MSACLEKEMTKTIFFLHKIQPFHFLSFKSFAFKRTKPWVWWQFLFVCCLCICLLNWYVVFEASSTCDRVQQSRFSDAAITLSRTFVSRDFSPTAPTLSTECWRPTTHEWHHLSRLDNAIAKWKNQREVNLSSWGRSYETMVTRCPGEIKCKCLVSVVTRQRQDFEGW